MKKFKSILSSKNGDSIIEIMVSVTLLLLISAFFLNAMIITTRLIGSGDANKKKVTSFCDDYYMGNISSNSVSGNISLKNQEDGSSIPLNTKLYSAPKDGLSIYSFGQYSLTEG